MAIETLFSICLGIGLAASVGFRVFVPLFALSLAAYFNVLQLNTAWEWVGETPALVTLGVATLVEICAYFIPYLDNLLDSVAVPLAALAGTTVMLSTVVELSPLITWVLAIIAGGGTAVAIAGSTGTTRLASTASTAGIANPVISILETGTSVIMSVLSVFLPILALFFTLLILYLLFKIFNRFRKTKRPSV